MAKFRLSWPLDPDGYRIVEKAPRPRKKGQHVTLLEGVPDPVLIAEKRERKPLAPIFADRLKVSRLLHQLAEVRVGDRRKPRSANREGALAFVKTYGFLREAHGPETVDFIVGEIEAAQAVLPLVQRKDARALQWWTLDNLGNIGLHPKFIYFEDDDKSELFFGPNTLLDAIYLQALQDVSRNTEFEACDCPGCPEWFPVGPGTGRSRIKRGARRQHRYCSAACQKSHAYMIKKGEVK